MNSIYNGTVHDIGTVIPNFVHDVYTPHIWYDQSKSYGNNVNIFEALSVSESLILGESEDDLWTMEEILTEILQYLNLHIIQNGYDYYIFDWETSRTADEVEWLDIFTGETITKNYDIVNIDYNMYAASDTQISIADVYNQISVKDSTEKFEDVLMSPFDEDLLENITSPQLYMIEYASPGQGDDALNNFKNMLNGGEPDAEYGKDNGETSFKKQWCIKLNKMPYWGFYKNGIDCYNNLPVDGNGNYYNQWQFAKYLHETPFASGLISFGEGKESNQQNSQNIENITSYDNYICISVNGNGVDEKSASFNPFSGAAFVPPAQFPTDNDLHDANMEIKYLYATDGNYSSSSQDVTNYLLFNGEIMLTTTQEYSGVNGFPMHGMSMSAAWANSFTKNANDHQPNSNYVDWVIFSRNGNTFSDTKTFYNTYDSVLTKKRVVPSAKNDDGMYYQQLFFDTAYPIRPNTSDVDRENTAIINLSPPLENGDLSKRFHYVLGSKTYYGENDIIPYVDVLACQLSIGNKYCEEYVEDGLKHFRWVTTDDLMNRPNGEGYETLPDGTIRYNAYVNLAINIDTGDWVIGQKHQIYNNVFTNMGLDKTGMAIPLPYSEHLTGEMRFSIIGPVNNTWDNGTRRHPTWFRHTQLNPNEVSILPHVGKIWISKFDVELVSDAGKNVKYNNDDIVYRSDEQHKYVNSKDDIEFRFTTALTGEEAAQMHVNYGSFKSNVINSDGDAILSILNNVTNEIDKPEKHYVDAYYREYSSPKMIVETTLHDNNDLKRFNKFNIHYLNKTFHLIKSERNVINATTKLTIKEI